MQLETTEQAISQYTTLIEELTQVMDEAKVKFNFRLHLIRRFIEIFTAERCDSSGSRRAEDERNPEGEKS